MPTQRRFRGILFPQEPFKLKPSLTRKSPFAYLAADCMCAIAFRRCWQYSYHRQHFPQKRMKLLNNLVILA